MSAKNTIMIVLSAIGGFFVDFVGGTDTLFKALVIFMIADYFSGLAVALVFHKSRKTKNGCASSKEGYKGIVKKLCMLMLVGIAHVLDEVIGVHCLREVTISFFLMNEGLSLLENLGLMGIKYPAVLTKALEVLCDNADTTNNDKKEGTENE